MGKKKARRNLGAREREILDIMFELGEGSVSDVLARMADPPSYSAVRTMIRLLETKGFLKHARREGTRYIYRPTQSRAAASQSALRHVLRTFFGGSAPDAVAAIFDAEHLSADDLERIEQLIEDAREGGQK